MPQVREKVKEQLAANKRVELAMMEAARVNRVEVRAFPSLHMNTHDFF